MNSTFAQIFAASQVLMQKISEAKKLWDETEPILKRLHQLMETIPCTELISVIKNDTMSVSWLMEECEESNLLLLQIGKIGVVCLQKGKGSGSGSFQLQLDDEHLSRPIGLACGCCTHSVRKAHMIHDLDKQELQLAITAAKLRLNLDVVIMQNPDGTSSESPVGLDFLVDWRSQKAQKILASMECVLFPVTTSMS